MKHFLFTCLLGMLFAGGGISVHAQSKYTPKYLKEDDKAFKELVSEATPNGWMTFKAEAKVKASSFLETYGKRIGLGDGYSYKLIRDKADIKENRHVRYQLYWRKIPIEGAEYDLHSRNDILGAANGRVPLDLTIDVEKPMPESKALDFALADQKLTTKDFKGDEKTPKGQLLLASIDGEAPPVNRRSFVLIIN